MLDYSTSPMTLAKRVWFNELISHLITIGKDKYQIASEINISAQRLTNILNGSDAVSDKIIEKLVATYDLGPIEISTKSHIIAKTEATPKERIIDRFDRYLIISGISDGQATANAHFEAEELKKARQPENDLSKKQVKVLLNIFKDINEEWLIKGTGDMRNSNALAIKNSREPMGRILDLLNEEGVSLEDFAMAANSYTFLFNNALKYPIDSRSLIIGNDKQIRGWVDAFCELFPKYSKFWILTGKTSKYNYPITNDPQ